MASRERITAGFTQWRRVMAANGYSPSGPRPVACLATRRACARSLGCGWRRHLRPGHRDYHARPPAASTLTSPAQLSARIAMRAGQCLHPCRRRHCRQRSFTRFKFDAARPHWPGRRAGFSLFGLSVAEAVCAAAIVTAAVGLAIVHIARNRAKRGDADGVHRQVDCACAQAAGQNEP